MKKGTSTGPTICNICKRKKEIAIREQSEKGSGCGNNKCTFDKEIKSALESKKKIKILAPIKVTHNIKILPPLGQKQDGKNE